MQKLTRVLAICAWIVLLLFLPLLTADLTTSQFTKLDPGLKMVLPLKSVELQKAGMDFAYSANAAGEPEFDILIKFQGDPAALKLAGVRIMATVGPIATARASAAGVRSLARLAAVKRMELSRRHEPCLDVSRISTGVDKLFEGNPLFRGNGVIVGIFDSGIDWRHEDFIDAQGRSRILYIWDVTDDGGPAPAGFDYGTEYTRAQINDEIDGSPTGLVREKDTSGHGTHVAGIAAGDGSATGNGVDAYTYRGMAPQADLIIVKGGKDGYSTTNEVNGLAYITQKARALGRPVAVNYSIAGHWGAHDGTDLTEQAIDAAAAPGQIVVVAAANEGGYPVHALGWVSYGAVAPSFNVKEGANDVWIDIWHSGKDVMKIRVAAPGGFETPEVRSGALEDWKYWDSSSGRIGIIAPAKNADNGDYEFAIYIDDKNGTAVESGEWLFFIEGVSLTTDGRFDAWTQASKVEFTTCAENECLVGMPGTARQAITVASYCTKKSWPSINGSTQSYTDSPALWDISSFSSPGPTRDGREKPDITAPGHGIMSALSRDADASQSRIGPDGVHQLMQGTSMAAPHVTGAVALLLEKDPTLTPEEAKTVLIESAWVDNYTGAVWNSNWGNGKLEIDAAIALVEGSIPGTTAQCAPGNVNCGLSDWGAMGTMSGAEAGFQFPAGCDDHGYGGSLVAGVSAADVADSYGGLDQVGDDTWRTCENGGLRLITPGLVSDQDGSAEFEKWLITPAGLTLLHVQQNSYAWGAAPYDQFVLLDYELRNLGPHPLDGLVTGFFMDWDCLPNSSTNEAGYDANLNLAYMWDSGSNANPRLGTMLLGQQAASFDIINNANSVYEYGDLPDDVMFNLMSSPGFMGGIGTGDLSTLLAAGKINLAEGKSMRLCVALIAGNDLADLRQTAGRACEKYNALGKGYTSLYYDDGVAEGGLRFTTPGERAAVRFTPTAYPAQIQSASFYTREAGSNLRVQLYDDHGMGGAPGAALLAAPITVTPQRNTWNTVNLSAAKVLIHSGDFYVSLEWISSAGPYLGYDSDFPHAGRSWSYEGGKWANFIADGDPWDKRDLLIGASLSRVTGVQAESGDDLPAAFALRPNYPNPFNSATTIRYQVGKAAVVKIALYNLLGQKVRVLLDEMRLPGSYEIQWNGQDQSGESLASGLYFCVLSTPDREMKQRLLLLR